MLVLSRHPDKAIIIGDNIIVRIVDVRGNKVRLGIEAPRDLPVDRLEVREAKVRNGNAPPPDTDSHRLDGEDAPC